MSRPTPKGLPKGKFDGLQGTDALALFDEPDQAGGMPTERPRATRTAASGACPGCLGNRVGLVPVTGHLAWRNHTKQLALGGSTACRASGVLLCHAPARDVLHITGRPAPACLCVPRPRVIA